MMTRRDTMFCWLAACAWMMGGSCAAVAEDRIVLPADVRPVHYDIELAPDVRQMTFAGSVKIAIDVLEPTRSIVLNALDLTFGKAALDEVRETPAVAFNADRQTATLTFAAPVAVGRHVLSIDYSGKINLQAAGLFALDYATPHGKSRALFTQFENSDARRFVPCWDEPAQKATFTLAAVLPADQTGISNMPVASIEPLPGRLQRVHFMQSPKMSTYLLFFGSGDFERVVRQVNGVEVAVIVKRGDSDKTGFALDAAADLLAYYEDYFGLKYPLPKLDLIAAPGSSQFFSAMENWGAILYFERYLLIDPKISTQADSRLVYGVVAHEMAHQWFGDLVTMAWWDDIWLNEGFASWMTDKATDHFHPEWTPWLDSLDSKEFAMRTDARRGTHPIIQPIHDVLQANEAFDVITYSKGEAVVRMLENYVGEERFRDGVRSYLKKHAYGNTVSDDLWAELDRTASSRISDIAHDFTRQAGVPLVRATKVGSRIRLTEDRFAVDDSGKDAARWRVPVVRSELSSHAVARDILNYASPLEFPAAAGVVINAGQAGYFRTLYAPNLMHPLVAHFGELSSADELGLINDSSSLGYAGYEPLSDFLAMTAKIKPAMDPAVLRAIVSRLQGLDSLYEDLPQQVQFRAFARRVLRPLLAGLGWADRAGESQNSTLLRQDLLNALAEFDDAEVVARARAYFADYLRDPGALSVDLRHAVLAIVALHADAAQWEELHALAKNAASELEKQELYGLLGTARDPALANRALQLALSDEAIVTTRPDIMSSVSGLHPDMAFYFAQAHLEPLMAMLEPETRNQFVPGLVSGSHDPAMIARLRAYALAHIPATARQNAVKAEAQIAYKVKIRRQRLGDVDRWLKSAAPQSTQSRAGYAGSNFSATPFMQ